MARFTIKAKNGQSNRYTGTPVYHGTHLKVGYIEFREVASPTLIPWEVGDYVDYTRTGFRYKLYSVPQPEKRAVATARGDSFVYHDVQLHCATKDLEIAPFRDLVISDNTIHFTTLQNVSTYEDVFGIARRIQANLDSFYGEGEWIIRVIDTSDPDLREVLLQTKEFSISDGSCLDALSQIYAQWRGIGWVYSVENGVNTVTIGRPNIQDGSNTTSTFAYGLGNGITVLKKEQSGKNDLVTRLYAYGSTRNIIPRYYNNITPAIKDAESVYIPNLMIPLSHWGETDDKKDASKAFLEASQTVIDRYGLRTKTIYFDGSSDYEEICPSVEGMTAGQVRAAMQTTDDYYPDPTFASDNQRLDEVAAAVNPTDNGVISSDTGGKYVQTVTLLGVTYNSTYNMAVGQDSAKIPLNNITVASTISAAGKVTVTPQLVGTVHYDTENSLGALSVRLWIEIAGKKYGERPANITRGKNGIYQISLDPFEIVTEDTGSVIMKGYIYIGNSARDTSHQIGININPGTTTLEVKYVPADTFKVYVRQLGFDISKQQSSASGGLCTISFKSGWCAGRDFTVKKCEYVETNDRWMLTVARQSDDSIGQYFPNNIYKVEAGDRFVLIDLTMPEIYHTAAAQRLYDRASEVLDAMSTPKYVYEPDIDAKVLALSPETILEGMYMPVQDADVVDDVREFVLIDSIEIDEGAAEIPTYKVTLQDEKRENFIAKLTRESGRNERNITEIELRDLRNEVEELTPSVTEDIEVSVEVVASHPIIGYEHSFDEEPVNVVTLTCVTTGIDNPTYQWYYLGPVDWVAITGATAQAYVVDPDSELYYQNGEIVEDFRCVVSGDTSLSDSVQIMKVLSASFTVSLSNPAHVFKAGAEFAEAATDRVNVLGYNGTERMATNVKMTAIRFLRQDGTVITTSYAGGNLLDSGGNKLTDSDGKYLLVAGAGGASIYDGSSNLMMRVQVHDNNTTATYLTVEVTNKLNIPSGVIEIPIIIREADASAGITEQLVNLYYSWALALKGDSNLIADLSNETDGLAVGSDGILTASPATLTTKAYIYYGNDAQAITAVTEDKTQIPSSFRDKFTISKTGIGTTEATVSIAISASASSPIDFTGVDSVRIPMTVTCAKGSRIVTYSLVIVKDGEDGAVFMLEPSADVIKGARNSDNTITYSPTSISCARMMRKGAGDLAASTYGVLKMSLDGGTTKVAYSALDDEDVEWASFIQAGKIIYYWFDNAQESHLIDRETIPVVVDGAKGDDGEDGDNGYSASTIYLYKRSANGMSTSDQAPGDSVYTFANGTLAAASGASLNGWQQQIPTGDDPCYVTMFFAQANTATLNIPGGWNTVSGGSWAPPTRLTGDNGLQGKVMRGINEYSQYGLGTQSDPVNYQGLRDTDTSHVYYDMVYTESGGTRTYYYCQNEKKGSTYARDITPGTESDSDTTARCWIAATYFDFVATRVLLASNAFIDILSGNGIYVYDTGQDYIVAGLQGGTGVNFFAGTHPETSEGAGDAVTPANAPFRINYDGSVYASNMTVEGGAITVNSAAETTEYGINSIKTNQGISAKRYIATNGSGQSYKQFLVRTELAGAGGNIPLVYLISLGGDDALYVGQGRSVLSGGVLLSAQSNNLIGSEYIISSPTVKHFVDIEESDYDAMEQAGTLDANTTYFVYPDDSLS